VQVLTRKGKSYKGVTVKKRTNGETSRGDRRGQALFKKKWTEEKPLPQRSERQKKSHNEWGEREGNSK